VLVGEERSRDLRQKKTRVTRSVRFVRSCVRKVTSKLCTCGRKENFHSSSLSCGTEQSPFSHQLLERSVKLSFEA